MGKIEQAVQASVNTVRGLQNQRVTQFELDRAKRNLLTRHDSDMKDNGYWVSLLTHLQNDLVPHKDIGCLQDLVRMYDEAVVADIYEAFTRTRRAGVHSSDAGHRRSRPKWQPHDGPQARSGGSTARRQKASHRVTPNDSITPREPLYTPPPPPARDTSTIFHTFFHHDIALRDGGV